MEIVRGLIRKRAIRRAALTLSNLIKAIDQQIKIQQGRFASDSVDPDHTVEILQGEQAIYRSVLDELSSIDDMPLQ